MPKKTDQRYEFLPYTTGASQITPQLGDKKFRWGKQGAFHVKDQGEAAALEQKYDGMVVSMPVSSPDIHDRGHRYFFGGWPEMPWKRKTADGNVGTENGNSGRDGGTPPEHAA